MRTDNLQQFIKLRRELTQEKDQISRRLAQINEALGELASATADNSDDGGQEEAEEAPAARPAPASNRRTAAPAQRSAPAQRPAPSAAPSGGGSSLREHVMTVLRDGPKSKEEVLKAVQGRGYKFQTKDPLNSLGVILYGKNPKFNRVDGRFALPGGGGNSGGRGSSGAGQQSSGKRTMSPEARERIAAAQRARWAATRKGR
jgi:hypothetical protein